MPRVRSGKVAKRRHKKILKLSKGYIGSKRTLYKTAHEQVMRAHQNAYIDRKRRKRDFRKLWITRINAATRLHGLKYSRFMHGLALANITVNRKMLSEIAINNPEDFKKYVDVAIDAIENPSKYVKEEKAVVKKDVKPAVKKAVKTEVKKEEKPAFKEEKQVVDYSKLLVKDLKELAKERNIEGYSTMLKAELVEALTKLDK